MARQDHYLMVPSSKMSGMLRAGPEQNQNLGAGFVELRDEVVVTTAQRLRKKQ